MKLTLENLQKLILESMSTLAEEDKDTFIDGGDLNLDNNFSSPYKSLGLAIEKLANTFSEVTISNLDKEVDVILEKGRGNLNLNYGKAVDKSLTADFDYVVSVLAALYKTNYNNIINKKNNIVHYLFYAFYPVPIRSLSPRADDISDRKERLNQFGHAIATRANVLKDLSFSNSNDVIYFIDAIKDSVRDGLIYCLNKFDPNSGTFSKYMMIKSANLLVDAIRDKSSFMDLTANSHSKESLDDLIGFDDDATKSSTLQSTHSDIDDVLHKKRSALAPYKSKQEAIDYFIRKVLSKNGKDDMLKLYDLDQKGERQEKIADALGISPLNVRQKKFRLQKYLDTAFVETGKMQKFLAMNGFDSNIPTPFNLSNKSSNYEPKPSSDSSFVDPESVWNSMEFSSPSKLKEHLMKLIKEIIAESIND